METVVRKVCDPVTKQVYEIQLPAPTEIERSVPELDFPSEGFRYRDVAAILAKKFQLSDEQVNAKYKSQVESNTTETVWRDMLVFPTIRELFKEGKLEQPGGRGKPSRRIPCLASARYTARVCRSVSPVRLSGPFCQYRRCQYVS